MTKSKKGICEACGEPTEMVLGLWWHLFGKVSGAKAPAGKWCLR